MIFDNCEKYIIDEVNKNNIFEKYINKKVIIFGLESLSKTLYHILKSKNIDIEIVDFSESTNIWAGQVICKSIDFNKLDLSTEFFVTTNNNNRILQELFKNNGVEKNM